MNDDDFDLTAFVEECDRDLAAARAVITRRRHQRDQYRRALQRLVVTSRVKAQVAEHELARLERA